VRQAIGLGFNLPSVGSSPPLFSDICFLINWLSCFRRYGVGM